MNELIFKRADESVLDAASRLFKSENVALVRLSSEGRIIMMTENAARLLGAAEMETIFPRISAQNQELLRRALERGEPCRFWQETGSQRYNLSAEPTDEGALLLLVEWQAQTVLDAKVQIESRNNLQGLYAEAYLLRNDHPEISERMGRQVGRIDRAMYHASLLKRSAEAYFRPEFLSDDLAALCRRAAESIEEASWLKVHVQGPRTMPAVYDAKMILIALLNLATNAEDATELWISLAHQEKKSSRQSGMFFITVEDNGKGLSPEKAQYLYNEWQQPIGIAKTHRMEFGGIAPGLGLPVVALVAEYHEGRLLYEEREGGGARFCLSFSDSLMPDMELRCGGLDYDEPGIIQRELSTFE